MCVIPEIDAAVSGVLDDVVGDNDVAHALVADNPFAGVHSYAVHGDRGYRGGEAGGTAVDRESLDGDIAAARFEIDAVSSIGIISGDDDRSRRRATLR